MCAQRFCKEGRHQNPLKDTKGEEKLRRSKRLYTHGEAHGSEAR
jgi:hypothetical protein